MDILLIAGLWLDGTAWHDVLPELTALGHRPVPITLPGQGDGTASATLDDQLAAVTAAVDAADGKPLVVGHSAACTMAWLAADRRPDGVAGVALIGGLLPSDGDRYADLFGYTDGVMPFPGWDPFEGPDAADLDRDTRRRIEATMVTVPETVTKGVVRYHDERRFEVPLRVVCPEFTPDQAREWVAAGESPEVAAAKRVEYVDIESGHWPMYTRPAELARLLVAPFRA